MISLYGLTGTVVTPKDPDYTEARLMWNRAIMKFPGAIGVPFRIRNGRHNYEGYSTGNGVLVIDVSRLIDLDMDGNCVIAQGGVNNSMIYDLVSS